jgi:hypothetical protein
MRCNTINIVVANDDSVPFAYLLEALALVKVLVYPVGTGALEATEEKSGLDAKAAGVSGE